MTGKNGPQRECANSKRHANKNCTGKGWHNLLDLQLLPNRSKLWADSAKFERDYAAGRGETCSDATCLLEDGFAGESGRTHSSSICTATDRCKSVIDNTSL